MPYYRARPASAVCDKCRADVPLGHVEFKYGVVPTVVKPVLCIPCQAERDADKILDTIRDRLQTVTDSSNQSSSM